MLDLVGGHGGNQREEVLERCARLICISESLVVDHHFAHEVVCILALLLHQAHSCIKHLYGLQGFSANGQVIRNSFKRVSVEQTRQVF